MSAEVVKSYISVKADWYDVKQLVRRVLQLELRQIRVERFRWENDRGWLVTVRGDYMDIDVYFEELQRCVKHVIKVGDDTVWIGVYHG